MKNKNKEKELYNKIQVIFIKAYVIFLAFIGIASLFFITNVIVVWNIMPSIFIFIIAFNVAGQLFYFRKKLLKLFIHNKYKKLSSEEKSAEARKQIKKSATKVAIETMLSPWPMVDAIIVLVEVFQLFIVIKKIFSLKLGIKNSFIFLGQVTAALILAFQIEKYDKYIASGLRELLSNAFSNITAGITSKVGIELGKSISNASMISWLGFTLCNLAYEQEKSKKIDAELVKKLGEEAKKEARSIVWLKDISKEIGNKGRGKIYKAWDSSFKSSEQENAEIQNKVVVSD